MREAEDAEEGRRSGWVLPGILVVLLVVLVASSLLLLHDRDGEEPGQPRAADIPRLAPRVALADDGAPGAAVLAARRAAVAYFSLDHRHLAADVRRFEALLTDGFRARARAQLDRVRDDVARRALVVRPTVPPDGMATEYLGAADATVLVSVDATTTAKGRPSRMREYRTRVMLRRVGERWWVSDLERLP